MKKKNESPRRSNVVSLHNPHDALVLENQRLREKLEEAEELLDAIRTGRVDALVVSGQDEQVVYTLKGADHTYRILIETMNEGAVILSASGTILYCNHRFAEMMQTNCTNMVGSTVDTLLTSEEAQRFRSLQQQIFGHEAVKGELQLKTCSGKSLPALVSLNTVPMEEMVAIGMVVTDLTEQKYAQQTLKVYSERMYRKNAELNRRAEQLARLSVELTMTEQRERKRLSKILHDGLQQHLAAAKLQLGSMAEQVGRTDLRQAAGEIEETLSSAIRMARSLSAELSPPILHAGGLAAGLEWLARWMQDMHNLEVELVLETRAALGEDVRILVFESVRELLFNAVKHAKIGRVRVILQSLKDAWIRLTVSDEGEGFDPRRFEPTSNSGGLGLFSIHERIHLIGGTFEIDSAPGRGCRITLTVPSMVEPAAAGYALNSPVAGAVAENYTHAEPFIRVLLADDHTLFRDGMARLLSKEPNIEVVGQASDGRTAIELARKLRPHVILMDISMPGVDGIEATRIIHQQLPQIRIIGLSMYEDDERAQVMREAGAVGYKNKACPAAELISAVENAPSRY